jgi:hypothetical protein
LQNPSTQNLSNPEANPKTKPKKQNPKRQPYIPNDPSQKANQEMFSANLTVPYEGEYSGNFTDNQRQGMGELLCKTGVKYIGNFSQDLVEGQGQAYFPGGEIYRGWFSDGRFEGEGHLSGFKCDMIWPNCSGENVYTGWFTGGKADGNGQLKCGYFFLR